MLEVRLAWLALARRPWLTAVMIACLAVGLGTWALTRVALASQVRFPHPTRASFVLADRPDGREGDRDPLAVAMVSIADARALRAAAAPLPATVTFGVTAAVRGERGPSWAARTRAATRALFAMFGFRFVDGGPWTDADDAEPGGDVVVVDETVARRAFGDVAVVGRELLVAGRRLRITGVIAPYALPKVWDVSTERTPEAVYAPFETVVRLGLRPAMLVEPVPPEPEPPGPLASSRAEVAHVWIDAPAREVPALAARTGAELLPLPRYFAIVWGNRPALRAMAQVSWFVLAASLLGVIRLMLANLQAQRPRLALQRALGAPRGAMVREQLVAAALVALAGAAAAVALAFAGLVAFDRLLTYKSQAFAFGAVDALVTLAAAAPVALALAAYPALLASRVQASASLRLG